MVVGDFVWHYVFVFPHSCLPLYFGVPVVRDYVVLGDGSGDFDVYFFAEWFF